MLSFYLHQNLGKEYIITEYEGKFYILEGYNAYTGDEDVVFHFTRCNDMSKKFLYITSLNFHVDTNGLHIKTKRIPMRKFRSTLHTFIESMNIFFKTNPAIYL